MVLSSVKVWSRLETGGGRGFGPGGGAEDAEDEDGDAVTDVEGPAEVGGGGDTGVGGAAGGERDPGDGDTDGLADLASGGTDAGRGALGRRLSLDSPPGAGTALDILLPAAGP
jgi:hypothetical protein